MKHLETAESSRGISTKGSGLEVLEAGLTTPRLIPARQKVDNCESSVEKTLEQYIGAGICWLEMSEVVEQHPDADFEKIHKLYHSIRWPGVVEL
jgi:hypothetical protein